MQNLYNEIMSYYDKEQNRIHRIIASIIIVGWVLFAVSTLLEWDVVYNFTSPVVTFLSSFLIYKSLDYMGKYRVVAIWFMMAIFVWFLGDLMWLVQSYLAPENEIIETITDNIYLIPDYIYVGGLFAYASIRFKKNDLSLLMIDTFVLSIVAFVLSQSAFEYANPEYKINFDNLNTILYFFVCIFTLFLVFLVLLNSGLRRHAKAFYLIGGVLLLNNALEIRYTAMKLIGKESESVLLDILYILFIVIFALGLSFGKLHKVDLEQDHRLDNPQSFTRRNFGKRYWGNATMLVLVSLVLYFLKVFDGQDVFVFIIVAMAYVIMCKTLLTNMLSEELIEQQKNENSRLEQMVEEKTRELREMNAHLEKISNTDVLTGLYNRRYGMEYLSKLIQDAENYPIALYSLDLNYFKPINDNYGHDMGDVVLKEVGNRLAHLGQDRCTAIRVGGDEFLVIFRNASNRQAIENVGRLIAGRMDEPIDARVITEDKGEQEHTFVISASIGVARYPQDTADMDNLLKLADQALYRIKHTHEKSAYLLYSDIPEKEQETAPEEEQETEPDIKADKGKDQEKDGRES